jgi:hypothetical protein
VTGQDYEELFCDGWRDPGDDSQRAMVYFLMFFGLVGGLALAVYGFWGLLHAKAFALEMAGKSGSRQLAAVVGSSMIAIGSLIALASGAFLLKESKRWDLKHFTMERFVAGGFLLGFGLFVLGFETMQGTAHAHTATDSSQGMEMMPMIVCFAAGAIDLVFFLFVGLICAYLPKLRRRRNLSAVTVDTRMAIDEKLNYIEDHPCPWEDGLEAVVRLRLKDGSRLWLRPTPAAYDFASTGSYGVATVKGKVLERFEPKQRIGPAV